MYKVLDYIIRPKYNNWEGAIIEDLNTKEKFITNGVYKWEAREERINTCITVEKINLNSFTDRWNRNFSNVMLTLKK